MDDENGRYRWGATDEGLALVLRSETGDQLRGNTPWNVAPEGAVRAWSPVSPHALRGEHRVARGAARLPEPVR